MTGIRGPGQRSGNERDSERERGRKGEKVAGGSERGDMIIIIIITITIIIITIIIIMIMMIVTVDRGGGASTWWVAGDWMEPLSPWQLSLLLPLSLGPRSSTAVKVGDCIVRGGGRGGAGVRARKDGGAEGIHEECSGSC